MRETKGLEKGEVQRKNGIETKTEEGRNLGQEEGGEGEKMS